MSDTRDDEYGLIATIRESGGESPATDERCAVTLRDGIVEIRGDKGYWCVMPERLYRKLRGD